MAGSKLFVLICAIAWLLLPPVHALVVAPGDLVPICTAGGAQEHPEIDGDRVVWEDSRNGRYIYHSNTSGSGGQRVAGEDLRYADQRYPSVSGDVIVWQDQRHGNQEIYLSFPSGGEMRITNSTTDQEMPVVCGDYIAWYDTRHGRPDICLYNIETGRETYLNCSPVTEWKPAISEEYVVWEEASGGGDIWMYGIQTGKSRQITNDTARQTYPAISGDLIAWEDYRSGWPDIYIYNLSTGREQRITDNPAAQVSPAISGDLLVWEDKRNGTWEIYICDLAGDAGVQVPIAPTGREQVYPAISGNWIVWQSGRNSQSDIYGFFYTEKRPPVADFSVMMWQETAPFKVLFIDRTHGRPTSWLWDFGDGGNSTGQNPVHIYTQPGTYKIRLSVATGIHGDVSERVGYIRIATSTPNGTTLSSITDTSPGWYRGFWGGAVTDKKESGLS